MIYDLIKYVFWGSFGLSSVITLLNTTCSYLRIRTMGYKLKSITENTVTENVKYAVKDYGFLLLPVYNVVKSIKNIVMKDSKFDKLMMEKLANRDRLIIIEKKESSEENPVTESTEPTKELATEPLIKDAPKTLEPVNENKQEEIILKENEEKNQKDIRDTNYRWECFGAYPDSVRRKPVIGNHTGKTRCLNASFYIPIDELENPLEPEEEMGRLVLK